MIFGRLDRRIEIEEPVTTYDALNAPILTWKNWKRVWAQYIPDKIDERYSNDTEREQRLVRFRTRYWSNFSTLFRIVFEGNYYRVRGVTEIGRREGLEVDCEYLQGQANEP